MKRIFTSSGLYMYSICKKGHVSQNPLEEECKKCEYEKYLRSLADKVGLKLEDHFVFLLKEENKELDADVYIFQSGHHQYEAFVFNDGDISIFKKQSVHNKKKAKRAVARYCKENGISIKSKKVNKDKVIVAGELIEKIITRNECWFFHNQKQVKENPSMTIFTSNYMFYLEYVVDAYKVTSHLHFD